MTPAARTAVGCAAALVVATGAVVAVRAADDPSVDARSVVATTSPTADSPMAKAATPSATATPTPTAVGPSPLSVEAATAVAPRPGGDYLAAEVPVELASVCERASLQLTDATPVYASLQTAAAPLRYLDVAFAVYEDADSAAQAYDELTTSVAACPLDRTIVPTPAASAMLTPSPAPSAPVVSPISVHGESSETSIGTRSALQWLQLQTVDEPPTQLRTAVTVTVVENVLIMVSVDEDSETATAEQITAASLDHTTVLVERLVEQAAAT
jgi:hypothetical protein